MGNRKMIRALENMSMNKNLSHDRGVGRGRGREGEWERQTGEGVSMVETGIRYQHDALFFGVTVQY